MQFILFKIKLISLLLIFTSSLNLYSQILDLSLIGKTPYETKNILGSKGFVLILEKKDIQFFEKHKKPNLGDPIRISIIVYYCNEKVHSMLTDFVFIPSEEEEANLHFNLIREKIKKVINPKPKKRKKRKLWKPSPSESEFNILGKDLTYIEKTVWKKINDLDIVVAKIKQINNYYPYKSGIGMNITRVMFGQNIPLTDCKKYLNYYNFFEKYFIEEVKPDDLNYYLFVYIDDLNNFGVFNHLKIQNNSFTEILTNFTQNFNIYFKDIRESTNKPDYNTIAIAHSMNNNCKLDIQVDISNWSESTNTKRLWILYHELTHDLFNVEHGHGGPLMNPTIPPNLTEEYFLQSRKTLINYLKLLKFNNTCNEKGKFKLKKLLNNKN